MTIICPECATPYRLPPGLIPIQKSAAKCKKCGTRMIISPEKQDDQISATLDTISPINEVTRNVSQIKLPEKPYVDEVPDSDSPSNSIATNEAKAATDHFTSEEDIQATFLELAHLPPDKFKFSEIFSKTRSGSYKNRNNKLKAKLLAAVGKSLNDNILYNDEHVVNIAKGSAYHLSEIPYLNGILTLPTNYYAIVCTNFRLVLVNVDFKVKKTTRYVYQIFYEEIVRLGRGIFQTSLIFLTRSGKSWNFTTLGRSLSREINDLIINRKKEGPHGKFDGVSRQQLCPLCHTAISGYPANCPGCNAEFKNPIVALKRSLYLPGLGTIYLGYTPLGVIEVFLYFLFWLVLSSLAHLKLPGIIPLWLFTLLILHGTAGIMSLKLAKKGLVVKLIPAIKEPPGKTIFEVTVVDENDDLKPVI